MGWAGGDVNQLPITPKRSERAGRTEMGDGAAPPTRDQCDGIKAVRLRLKGGVARSRRQRNVVGGGGERGPSPPRPRARPGRPSRRRAPTGRDGTVPRATRSGQLGRPSAPTAGDRAAALSAHPRSRLPPLPHPLHTGRGRGPRAAPPWDPPSLLPDPSPPAPTSSAASLAGRPRSEREQTLGSFGGGRGGT